MRMSVRLMGRVRKVVQSPWDMIRARRKLSSRMGPRTKPKMMGAGMMPIFWSRYPMSPQASRTQMSKTVFRMAKDPMMQKIMMAGRR